MARGEDKWCFALPKLADEKYTNKYIFHLTSQTILRKIGKCSLCIKTLVFLETSESIKKIDWIIIK